MKCDYYLFLKKSLTTIQLCIYTQQSKCFKSMNKSNDKKCVATTICWYLKLIHVVTIKIDAAQNVFW
jgi:hypothetical protein